ncbi:TetR/AcrR family transcriptional regulator [Rhodococcus erythropolis]
MSRELILDAATRFIDQEGLRQLTMRKLGAWCGVEAMALYRYVSGRDELITAIVDRVIDTLYDDQLRSRREEDGGWQDYLQRLAHGVRAIALAHPELFPLIATRPPQAPWVRPPLRSLRWMETFLDTLLGYGFDDDGAVAAYRAFTTFLLGQLLLEVAARGTTLGPVDAQGREESSADLTDYPNLLRLQGELSQDHGAAEFEEALENLLDRLELYLGR